jgi:hypothetical protein
MKKKKLNQPVFKLWHILLAVGVIIAALAVQGYLMFLKPVSANSKIAAVAVTGAAQNPDSPEVQAVLKSGRAVRMNLAGCPNLCKVSDTLYRGAQPTQEGFENLKKLGIKTVVNLRDHHSDQELLGTTGLRYVPIPIDTWDIQTQHDGGRLPDGDSKSGAKQGYWRNDLRRFWLSPPLVGIADLPANSGCG